jgi:hypothetical protein
LPDQLVHPLFDHRAVALFVKSNETIAHLGAAGECCTTGFELAYDRHGSWLREKPFCWSLGQKINAKDAARA